jgi:hypothetical protein
MTYSHRSEMGITVFEKEFQAGIMIFHIIPGY